MAEPFLAELRLFSFNHPPKGWAFCAGQLLPINQNQALFSLLGTTYGGNGQTTFALPDLRHRVPVHIADIQHLGQRAGEDAHTLVTSELPQHTHFAQGASVNADTFSAPGNVLASSSTRYGAAAGLTSLHPSSVTNVGGSQAHENRQPFLILNWCIALQGIFPSIN
jgi:microcystin-dependent protein